MKSKYAILFICVVALVIIEKESSILSRVSDKLSQMHNPHQTPETLQDYSNTTARSSFTVLKVLLSKLPSTKGNFSNFSEEQPEEVDNVGNSLDHKHVLLMASTRTGSSFVGEFFNQHGESMFYLFEPLWHVERMLFPDVEANNGTLLPEIYRDIIQALFLCDFSPLEKFISPPPQDHVTPDLFRRESSMALCEEPVCTPEIKEVFERYHCKTRHCGPLNLTLASESCLSKQYRAIKTVRVRLLETLQPLLEDLRLDVRIIQLVRDPRAILASRMVAFSSKYQTWKTWAQDGQVPEDNEEVKRLKGNCDQLRISAEMGLSQPPWLRRRYMLVRYEDIARNPMQKAEEMYKFTGIPFSSQAREWILRNTQSVQEASGIYSTQKNSSEQADKWRFSIPFTLAQVVQKVCGPTMKLFGYKYVDDEKTLVNKSVSLLEEKQFH
ncbi:carbohydrate sulfotransferase 3 [Oryzias latipes]|uniref:Sulfotransferase n=1 Tax=Oryzias latipes TaxID=8090 RepID=H2LRE0_ORYLA|nr:carbohydrate sulfotransferase 3 [Oryzias latipes]XP_020565218.1 carbohydrate sulfotransferase 3 [Oryzias latipes]XP_020565219.1 carbohydrate sulfotransferase 3 [Oryzias latipes]XP_020565220.1 carbohydrate sulfotransferase 3 [Oryzias latipes]